MVKLCPIPRNSLVLNFFSSDMMQPCFHCLISSARCRGHKSFKMQRIRRMPGAEFHCKSFEHEKLSSEHGMLLLRRNE